jgi:hypothetical protein
MNTKSFKAFDVLAGCLTLAGAAFFLSAILHAQPLYDRIHVNLPYTVTMQNKTLQPGDYTIQQLPGAGDSRVLLFYTKDGLKFETSAMTIPALDPDTARDTKVILNHVGEDYYISKIWVQGKDYGYELPVPEILKSRQNERVSQTTLSGTYQSSSSTEPETSAATTTSATTTASAAPVAPPAAVTEPATAANTPASKTTPANTDVAQNTQPTPTPQPTEQPAVQPTPQPTAADNNSADRAIPDEPPAAPDRTTMPSTAAGWLTMLLSGGTLSGAGLILRRKR